MASCLLHAQIMLATVTANKMIKFSDIIEPFHKFMILFIANPISGQIICNHLYSRFNLHLHNGHGYAAVQPELHLGHESVDAVLWIKSHAAMCRFRRLFAALHGQEALVRASGSVVIHFGIPLAQSRDL